MPLPSHPNDNEERPSTDDLVATLESALNWYIVGDFVLTSASPPQHLDFCLDEPAFDPAFPLGSGSIVPHPDHAFLHGPTPPVRGSFWPADVDVLGFNASQYHSYDELVRKHGAPWNPLSRTGSTYSSSPNSTTHASASSRVHRVHSCLGCKAHSKPCYGFPLCQRCTLLTGINAPPIRMADLPFLDLPLWATLCSQLGRNMRVAQRDATTHACPVAPSLASCCNIVLGFEDLAIRRNIHEMHVVKYDPRLLAQEELGNRFRAPAIPGFDCFVLEAMWRSSCLSKGKDNLLTDEPQGMEMPSQEDRRRTMLSEAEKEKGRLSEAAKKLLTTIQLTLGYYSLLRHIDMAWTAETKVSDLADTRFALAELIYTLAFRVNLLFVDIALFFPSFDAGKFIEVHPDHDGETTTDISPAVFLYGIEILCRGLKSIGVPDWNLQHYRDDGALRRLQTNLSDAFQVKWSHVQAYGCRLFGWYNKRHREQKTPGLLPFARAAERGLPNHLIVTVQPLKFSRLSHLYNPFPLLQTQHGRFTSFDLFTNTDDELTLGFLDGTRSQRQRHPEHLITEHNSRLACRELSTLKYEIHHEDDWTNSSTGYPGSESARSLHLGDHPDPPRFRATEDSMALALTGLHFNDDWERGEQPDVSSSMAHATSTGFVIPESWQPFFLDAQGRRIPEWQDLDPRPQCQTLPERKRKQAEDGSEDELQETETCRSIHRNKRREKVLHCHAILNEFMVG